MHSGWSPIKNGHVDTPRVTGDVCAQDTASRSQAKGQESQEKPTCGHLDLGRPAWRTCDHGMGSEPPRPRGLVTAAEHPEAPRRQLPRSFLVFRFSHHGCVFLEEKVVTAVLGFLVWRFRPCCHFWVYVSRRIFSRSYFAASWQSSDF